ncbi:hypothetical protein AAG906_007103 [Vitis piasezkii]
MGPYKMAPPELEELRRQLKELLDAGLIQPSKAPYGASILFQKKHDGSLWMCIDYRALNKVTVKNKYPIPIIIDLFDQLGRVRHFTKQYLRLGYYQFLLMHFNLTNAPTTFCTLMNKIFHPYLDKFVVVYLDDIIIYSNTLKKHIEHLRKVFKILRQNELYEWDERCQQAFEHLKKVVTEESVLALPDHTKVFEYKPRSANHVVDALSCKAELVFMTSQPQRDIMDLLRKRQQHDPVAKSLIVLAHEGKTKRNAMTPSRLGTLGNDARGHYLSQLTIGLKYGMKLRLIVTMDFIIELPKSEDNDSIMVVVSRFSKYVTFIATPTNYTVEETTRLFLKHVVKYCGLPKYIISDHDPRFTRKFWMKLFKFMGSELHFSTSFHPQTNRQTERMTATNKSLFELAIGQQPLTPHTLTIGYTGEQANIARSYLYKVARKMKKWADKKRCHTEYKVGDMVLVKLLPQQFKSLRSVHKGLVRRYEGLFLILGKVDKVSYKVELPPRLKIYPVFHVSYLKPYHEDKDDPSRGFSKRAPTSVVTSYDKVVKHIIAN